MEQAAIAAFSRDLDEDELQKKEFIRGSFDATQTPAVIQRIIAPTVPI